MGLNSIDQKLLDRRIIMLEAEVNGEMLEHFRQCLTQLDSEGSPDVEIRITSNGGETRISLQICDLLSRYKGKKTGVVYAFARSAGATILQACDDRVCLTHSVVLIHHVLVQQVSLDDLLGKRRLDKLLLLMRADQKSLNNLLMARTGRSLTKLRAVCKKGRDMTAKEALKFGLIDRIE